MHRLRRAVVVTVAMAATLAAPVSCGPATTPTQPTLGSVDFRPKLVISIDERGLRYEPGERGDDAVVLDPPSVPSGTVIDIANHASADRRLQGATMFDTGIMRPGERTTVVVTNTTPIAITVTITDVYDDSTKSQLTVRPRPAGS